MKSPFLVFLLASVLLANAATTPGSSNPSTTRNPGSSTSGNTPSITAGTPASTKGSVKTPSPAATNSITTGNPAPAASHNSSTGPGMSASSKAPAAGTAAAASASPSPTTTTATTTSNSKPASNNGAIGGLTQWVQNILNTAGAIGNKPSGQSAATNMTQSLGSLFSKLPGVLQGVEGMAGLLGGGGGGGSDVGKILTGLFSGNQNLTGIPGWIQTLTQGVNSSKALQNVNIISNALSNMDTSSVNNVQMQALLLEIFPDVVEGLEALNLTANSTTGDILSAILSNEKLTSSMSTVAQRLVASLLTDPTNFPIDPTSACAADILTFGQGVSQGEFWALQMLDASGKIESGIMSGRDTLFGDYDECMDIDSGARGVNGQFYVMYIKAPEALKSLIPALAYSPDPKLKIHLCMPRSCEFWRLWGLFNPTIESIGSNITRLDKLDPRDPKDDDTFLGAMIAIGVLCFLSAVGTIYGIFVDCQKEAKKRENTLPVKMSANGNGHVNGGFHHDGAAEVNGEVTKRFVNGGNIKTVQETPFTDNVDTVNLTAARANGSAEGVMVNGHNGVAGGMNVNGTAPHAARTSDEESLPSKLLLSFSVLRNGRKLLDCTKHQSDISCLHGIRVLSITWVVLGHSFSQTGEMLGNKDATVKLLGRFTYMAIPGALLAVDTFFLLSGCLTAFLFLKSTKKSGLTVSGMILYYWHRYWRLTPLYGLLLAYYAGVYPYTVKGPFQNMVGLDSLFTCRDYWYLNILYVNNLFGFDKLCFGWSWYLSNDMQFYFIAPICLIPWALKGRVKIVGFIMAVALILTHIITTWVRCANEGLTMFGPKNADYMKDVYFKPWCRVGPYAVGLILGYIMASTRCKYNMEKLSSFLGWLVAATVGLTVVYIHFDNLHDLARGPQWSDMESASYEALAKVGWAICVSWVVFSCSTGHGGFVNTILSWSAWAPLSRMSYGVYLIHLIVMQTLQGNWKKLYYSDGWNATSLFLAVTVLSYLSTFFFSLLIEAPSLGLEKALLGKILRKKK